jgi:hypothetical protein
MIGGTSDFRLIGVNWDEALRLVASIKAGAVAPSILVRRLAAHPKQNALAKTLRDIGRLEQAVRLVVARRQQTRAFFSLSAEAGRFLCTGHREWLAMRKSRDSPLHAMN